MAFPVREEHGEQGEVILPVGSRLLWGIGALLSVGALICLLGLALTDPADNQWAIDIYVAGLASAVTAAGAVSGLVARRRRSLFEAESAVVELQRLLGRLSYGDEGLSSERPATRLSMQLEVVRGYRQALLSAEAFEQTLELDRAVAQAEDFLDGLRGSR
jgi:hypothetical protein